MKTLDAAGRPKAAIPLLPRVFIGLTAIVLLLEAAWRGIGTQALARLPYGGGVLGALSTGRAQYAPLRGWVTAHPVSAAFAAVFFAAALVVATRYWLLFWHNQVVARLSGTFFAPEVTGFPSRAVDVLAEIARRPEGSTFVGLSPSRAPLGWRWEPVYVSARQKTMHRQVVGKTGSGKTLSILWPQVLQDALDGKGVLVMSAKGSDEEVAVMKGVAALTGRTEQLRIFSLPAWNQPELFTHTYNMVHVRPRSTSQRGGDPVPVAERVFSVLPLGNNEYYNTQAQILFVNACKLLHGMVDERGFGFPFVMRDIAVFLKGVGNSGRWAEAVDYCLANSKDQEAAEEVRSQVSRLGRDVEKTFTGVIGAVDKFLSPIVNAYEPDIVFEDVLERNALVYVQLPANLFKIQAPAMGKVMLMDVQQEGSLRQVFRRDRNQRPFAVTVDEFYNFADLSIVDSLNKLRDANLEFTLAHQSPADLELVSKEFAMAVWDNTRTKDILNQDNPDLCEKVAKSVGTHQVVEKTVRQQQGALFTSLTTGDASNKLVETFRLHPNAIKGLARAGQGYLYNDEGLRGVVYGMLPKALEANYPLPRKDQSEARGLRLYERFIGRQSDPNNASVPEGVAESH